VRWNEAEGRLRCEPDGSNAGPNAADQYPVRTAPSRRRDDLLATARVWLLTWSAALLLLLEDDVAMMAFMFC
jgi:hypothetical protein